MVALMGREFKLEAFKEPRGFIRLLELVFTMLAFSFCAGFSSHMEFVAECKSKENATILANQTFTRTYSYPFALDHYDNVTVDKTICDVSEDMSVSWPGDYSSDAKFYVFIGVVSWLFCIATTLFYGFNNDGYLDNKSYPLYDMVVSVMLCFFFLASASAWAHGLSGLKWSSDPASWIFNSKDALLCNTKDGNYVYTAVSRCIPTFSGTFAGGNVSVLIGFLNCFLFGANVYYLFKETRFYNGNQGGNLENSPSGSM